VLCYEEYHITHENRNFKISLFLLASIPSCHGIMKLNRQQKSIFHPKENHYNIEKFQTNSDIHDISTKYRYNLHVPNTNLHKYQKGIYSTGIKLFNDLPHTIKSLNHDIKSLSQYLLSHSYSVEKFTSTKNSQLL
jgi:hypothetical protein